MFLARHDGALNENLGRCAWKMSPPSGAALALRPSNDTIVNFQVSVYANVATGYPLDLAAAHNRAVHQGKSVCPPGTPTYFPDRLKVLEETTWNLVLAMLLASIFMYMVLAAQFREVSPIPSSSC